MVHDTQSAQHAQSKEHNGPEITPYLDTFHTVIFCKYKLKITIKWNLKVADYLGVTLIFSDTAFKPFFKSENEISYIHK